MITHKDILDYLQKNKLVFSKKYALSHLGLFGSYVQNKSNSESDIDILIEFEPNTPHIWEKKLELKKEIEAYFGKEVDICRQKYLKPYFRENILKQVIYV